MNIGELRQRQSLPLEMKIFKSIRVIEEFYERYDGDVYISRGGVDSAVVAWLAQQSIYKDRIENVSIASCEPIENTRLNKKDGVTLLKSEVGKMEVITNYGYPLVSKDVAMKVSRYTRSKLDWAKDRRLNGYLGRNGKWIMDSAIPKKYQGLIYSPFELSEKCCDVTKKNPIKKYEKKTKKYAITGEMASESRLRETEYLKHGCIMHDKKRVKCTPIGFWTDQDVKECVRKYGIKISELYGEIIEKEKDDKKVLMFSGEQRSGCEICAFGIMFDQDRFERMKNTKPSMYNYMMRGGKWIRKDLYRWVKFRPNSMPIWSNLYFVPSNEGFGYKFVLNYFYKLMNIDREENVIGWDIYGNEIKLTK